MDLLSLQCLRQSLVMLSRDELNGISVIPVIEFKGHEITCVPFKELGTDPISDNLNESFDAQKFFKALKEIYNQFRNPNNHLLDYDAMNHIDKNADLQPLNNSIINLIRLIESNEDKLLPVPTDYLYKVRYMDNYSDNHINYIHLELPDKNSDCFKFICLIHP